jgi:hypothetical protein
VGAFGEKYKCERCIGQPSLAVTWGCKDKAQTTVPTFEEEEYGIRKRYWNCPLKLVPDDVHDFLRIRQFYKEFPGATFPTYEETSIRFLKAWAYYHSKTSEYERLVKHGR